MDDFQHRPTLVGGRELQIAIDDRRKVAGGLGAADVEGRVAHHADQDRRAVVALGPDLIRVDHGVALRLDAPGVKNRAVDRRNGKDSAHCGDCGQIGRVNPRLDKPVRVVDQQHVGFRGTEL